jgi:hypothetical protein
MPSTRNGSGHSPWEVQRGHSPGWCRSGSTLTGLHMQASLQHLSEKRRKKRITGKETVLINKLHMVMRIHGNERSCDVHLSRHFWNFSHDGIQQRRLPRSNGPTYSDMATSLDIQVDASESRLLHLGSSWLPAESCVLHPNCVFTVL